MENASQQAFDWINLPQGRVRYAGGAEGRDEPPIETFAIEWQGKVRYGEIRKAFLSDRHDYNLEVISFGWVEQEWHGSTPDPDQCSTLFASDVEAVQTLLCEAVQVWRTFSTRPFFLTEYPNSRFQGDVLFRDGWALTTTHDGRDHESHTVLLDISAVQAL
ncbi:MAG: hypothetical protein EON54_19255 [Alcaligenaceae bacterium]|nr:MAG: hypothetical protein EON54_19255 [Alcaligenaceae bacterium]